MFAINVEVVGCNSRSDLEQLKLLPEEQKGCRKRSRRTNDLVYIDRAVIREAKSRKENLAMNSAIYDLYLFDVNREIISL